MANATNVKGNMMESTEEASDASSTSTVVDSEIETVAEEYTDIFCLRFSLVARPFILPEYPEVAFEVKKYFADPETTVTPDRNRGEKFYIIELQ